MQIFENSVSKVWTFGHSQLGGPGDGDRDPGEADHGEGGAVPRLLQHGEALPVPPARDPAP